MQHLKGFGLENFRVFKDYTWFDFAPITLLIGPNNSGKSSLIKGLRLVKDGFYKPDFKLGTWDNILNDKNGILQFSLPIIDKTGFYDENSHFDLYYDNKKPLDKYTIIRNKNFGVFYMSSNSVIINIDYLRNFIETKLEAIKKEYVDLGISNKKKTGSELNNGIDFEMLFWQIDSLIGEQTYKHKTFIDFLIGEKVYTIKDKYEKAIQELEIAFDLLQSFNDNPILDFKVEDEKILENLRRFNFGKDNFHDETSFFFIAFAAKIWKGELLSNDVINAISNLERLVNFKFSLDHLNFFYLPTNKGELVRGFRYDDSHILNKLIMDYPNISVTDPDKWLNNFGINSYEIKTDTETQINSILINGRNIADSGFGLTQILTMFLFFQKKELEWMDTKNEWMDTKSICLLEEPEANLHPAFQSKLADMFLDAQKTFKQQFIIETHSEYMVRKFQYLVAKGEMKKEDIVIYYFNDPDNIPAGEPQVKKIEILEDGSLSDDFGGGFFDEAANWELELLRLKKNKIRQN